MAPRPKTEDAPLRTFKLRELVDAEGGPVIRVALGASPRVSLGTGETYATSDPKLADWLAATPELEETNA
jgi:hypothetical protein